MPSSQTAAMNAAPKGVSHGSYFLEVFIRLFARCPDRLA